MLGSGTGTTPRRLKRIASGSSPLITMARARRRAIATKTRWAGARNRPNGRRHTIRAATIARNHSNAMGTGAKKRVASLMNADIEEVEGLGLEDMSLPERVAFEMTDLVVASLANEVRPDAPFVLVLVADDYIIRP